MQKTVRINLQAQKNLLKQNRKQKLAAEKKEWNQFHLQKNSTLKKARQYVKEERANRREDWILGPLAPNRNVGTAKGTFGTMDVEAIQSPQIPKQVRAAPKRQGFDATDYEGRHKHLAFTGDTIVGNVVIGDRVVVVHGPDSIKGLIGEVTSVDDQREELRIQNVNVADIKIPPTTPQPPSNKDNPEPALYNTMEMPIPTTHVRLVVKMHNDDGSITDNIVRHVHAGAPYGQRALGSNLPAHTRYITGSGHNQEDGKDIAIPWPSDDIQTLFKHSEIDTVRQEVERHSWVPGVVNEPLGYHFDAIQNSRVASEATAPYTLGLIESREEADNLQRAGIAGFISQTKLDERRSRIARSIMNELKPRAKREAVFHDNTEWVKRKMLEDARAIWFRDRKILSPVAEAREQALQEKKRLQDDRLAKEASEGAPVVLEERRVVKGDEIQTPTRLPSETIDLIENMQALGLKTKFKPDYKFRKELINMGNTRWLKKTKMLEQA